VAASILVMVKSPGVRLRALNWYPGAFRELESGFTDDSARRSQNCPDGMCDGIQPMKRLSCLLIS
jgi:hypothetical protein